jgi:predicted DNA-binding transcriptional regulator AlpA
MQIVQADPALDWLDGALSINEFCAEFGFSRAWLYSLWQENEGPPYAVIGAKRMIPRRGAASWLASRVVTRSVR